MHLPSFIAARLDEVATAPTKELAQAADKLSTRYRQRDQANDLSIVTLTEAKAYALTRMPATFAAADRCLKSLQTALPSFHPERLLDIGAGTGTVALAALNRYPDIVQATLLEPNPYLRQIGKELTEDITETASIDWLSGRMETTLPEGTYDLLTCGYVLNELRHNHGDKQFTGVIETLWDKTGGALILIEPGTPEGQSNILAARDLLLKSGAHIAAPCPHSAPCPVAETGKAWCHFSVRVERSKRHRLLKKEAVRPYEDEKFSYLIATRAAPESIPAYRLIGHPRKSKVISVELCCANGRYEDRTIPKSSPDYKKFRKTSWGDSV